METPIAGDLPQTGRNDNVATDISFAADDAQRQSVYRLRYDEYCIAQGLLRERADHTARMLRESEDADAHLMTATQDGVLLGTMRLQWGGDAPFGAEMEETFDIAALAEDLRPDQIAVGSRFVLNPDARGGRLMVRMMGACVDFCLEHGVGLLFGDCEPHLVQMYRGLGFRTYKPLINHETSGVLVPLALACNDLDHLDRVRSPLRTRVRAARDAGLVGTTHYAGLLPTTEAIVSTDPNDHQGSGEELVGRLTNGGSERSGLFEGLNAEQMERLLARSFVLACDRGDALVRADHTSRTLYVVLEGTLEVRSDDAVVATVSRGEIFGEFAFWPMFAAPLMWWRPMTGSACLPCRKPTSAG